MPRESQTDLIAAPEPCKLGALSVSLTSLRDGKSTQMGLFWAWPRMVVYVPSNVATDIRPRALSLIMSKSATVSGDL